MNITIKKSTLDILEKTLKDLPNGVYPYKYTTLTREQSLKIWPLTLTEFNQTLSKDEIEECVDSFVDISGRDILNLVRLTSKVCEATKQKFSFKTLKQNAVFKSIKVKGK
jgi:hypothetical protein